MWLDPSNTAIGTSDSGVIVTTSGMDSSNLSISAVGASHAGRYMCVVTAGGAEQGNTSDITVQCKEDTCWESCCVSGCFCGEAFGEVVTKVMCGCVCGKIFGKVVDQSCV